MPVSIYYLSKKATSFRQTEVLATAHAIVASGIITFMIFSAGGVLSPYYAGLNLVGIIALCFFTFSLLYFCITAAAIYLPYLIIGIPTIRNNQETHTLILNTFFISGTIIVCGLIRYAKEKNRISIIQSRLALQNEIENRETIIRIKSEEAVKLSVLNRQFSPQVVESIRNGNIDINSQSSRAKICSIFVDIVNSTERVTKIDKEKVQKVISKFLDDSIKIFLKYDLTIDKFLGDGLLAFCNAPLQRDNYVQRVINAALEVKIKIEQDQDFYEKYWQREFKIRIGISLGFANIGFYGSKKYFQTYTAIGPVVNLASRLCASAEPGQIIIDYDIYEIIQNHYLTNYVGKKALKGFEEDVFHLYEVISNNEVSQINPSISECPKCGGIVSLEINNDGHFIFMCKICHNKLLPYTDIKKSAA
jgi:class 3 adenylate cyclase